MIANFLNITLFGISWLSSYEGEAWVLVLAKQTTNAIFNIKSFLPGVLISLLLLDIVYSTYRKNILRAIKSRLTCLSGSRQKKLQINQKKRPNVKTSLSDLADANQLRLSCGFIFYKLYPLGIYKCMNNDSNF